MGHTPRHLCKRIYMCMCVHTYMCVYTWMQANVESGPASTQQPCTSCRLRDAWALKAVM